MTYRALLFSLAAALAFPACSGCNQPPVKEKLKIEGDPCSADSQCDTGLCIAISGQQSKCGRKCTAGCTADEVCTQLDLKKYGCVPKHDGLCKPCETNSDCPYPADSCILVGAVKVCGRDCSFDNSCPESFHCDTAHTAEGADVLAQCVPRSGTCDCTASSVGQKLTCQTGTDAGTCVGIRTCMIDGYSACTAKVPATEVCNGADDNCNNQIDENLGETTCGLGECKRTVSNCVNGHEQICVPGPDSVEVCDGKDNNCDGTVDDGIDKNSVQFCGSCTNSCRVTNGTPKCTSGTCLVDTCVAPFKDCDGQYSNGCEANTDNSLLHCGACAKPCTAANATPTCATGLCSFVCLPGFGDLDKLASNGCEATCTSTDVPELGFIDTNCDGIDGNESKAVFVDALAGNNNNPGTKLSPKATISAGISAAASALPKKDVYVSKGIYAEQVTLASGVSLYGGYDASAGWSRSLTNFAIILSPGATGVFGDNLTSPTTVQLFNINAANATGNLPGGEGLSSYGVLLLNSPGPVTLSSVAITAGNGAPGAVGTVGMVGATGGGGSNAPGGTPKGAGGISACGANGGAGADGVGGATSGVTGTAGTTAAGGGLGAAGGNPGATGDCSLFGSENGGDAPIVSSNGSPGNGGAGGLPAFLPGVLDASSLYLPQVAGAGSLGFPGGGGGGGGSGGGTAGGTGGSFCTNCSGISSGGGGGGGAGGCPGLPGSGGRGGGGSFGIALVSSVLTVDNSKFNTGNGGSGGNGGNGGPGGGGGSPGSGTAGATRSNICSSRHGGAGTSGSMGGQGGQGGGGAGGPGGPSICILYKGISPTLNGQNCNLGMPGQGGAGGQGASTAQPGQPGAIGTVVTSN